MPTVRTCALPFPAENTQSHLIGLRDGTGHRNLPCEHKLVQNTNDIGQVGVQVVTLHRKYIKGEGTPRIISTEGVSLRGQYCDQNKSIPLHSQIEAQR